jgi:hypothetical protein
LGNSGGFGIQIAAEPENRDLITEAAEKIRKNNCVERIHLFSVN